MKDYSWKIKISNLLKEPGKKDYIKFEKKLLKNLNLEQSGISGEIFLQSLNHDEILLELKNIQFIMIYNCDKCLEKYQEKILIKNEKNIKFVNPEKIKIDENIFDNTFPMNIKNQIINIENLIEILVKNKEPIIKNCGKHKDQEKSNISKNQDEKNGYNFNFGRLLKS